VTALRLNLFVNPYIALIAVQGHPRSSTLEPIDSAYATVSYYTSNFGRICYRFQDTDA